MDEIKKAIGCGTIGGLVGTAIAAGVTALFDLGGGAAIIAGICGGIGGYLVGFIGYIAVTE